MGLLVAAALFLPAAAAIGYCNDRDASCAAWGKAGECTGNNSDVVKDKCPHTCAVCTILCSDTEEACDGWRRDGECRNSPEFMRAKCPTSCGLCSPKCSDIHANCNTWGQQGLCKGRPDIMHLHCPVTCGVCEGKCKDTMNDCPGWAAKGECINNPGHSLINCPLSCGTCAAGPCSDVNVTTCALWAISGQCEQRPEYMAKECPASCGICTNVCEDKETDCANWAMEGECQFNPEHMLVTCPQSCGLCSRLETFVQHTSRDTWMPMPPMQPSRLDWVNLPKPVIDAMNRIQDGQRILNFLSSDEDREDEEEEDDETNRVLTALCAALCSALLTTAAACTYVRQAQAFERAWRPSAVARAIPRTGGTVERSRRRTLVGRVMVAAAKVINIPRRAVSRAKSSYHNAIATLAKWDDRFIALLLPRHSGHAELAAQEEQQEAQQVLATQRVAARNEVAAKQEAAGHALAADRSRNSEARRDHEMVRHGRFESTSRFMCLDTSVEEVVRTPCRVAEGARQRSERGAASGGAGSSRDHEREEAPAEVTIPKARKMRQRGMFSAHKQTTVRVVPRPSPPAVHGASDDASTGKARVVPAQPPLAVRATSDNAEITAVIAQSLASQQAEERSANRSVGVITYAELSAATSNFAPSKIVGVGGFGSVYRSEPILSLRFAAQGVPRTPCAVKRLNAGISQSEGKVVNAATLAEVKKSVIKEVDLLGRCTAHPNLLPLLGYSLEQSCPACLVFPLCVGGTLEDRLLKGSSAAQRRLASLGWAREPLPLTWRARLNILRGAARALVHLHAHQLLHGDVKPSNILLDAVGDARLADFGLAHMAKKREASSTGQSSFSTVKGTAEYLDPI
jgi:hypothetical protein